MSLPERIIYIIENNAIRKNISDSEFARSIGTYPTKIADIKSGKVKSLPAELLLEISKKYRASLVWLISGEGEPFLPELTLEEEDQLIQAKKILDKTLGSNITDKEAEILGKCIADPKLKPLAFMLLNKLIEKPEAVKKFLLED